MAKSQFLECGRIVNTHGCRGGLKIESWCNTPQDLAGLKRIFFLEGGAYTPKNVVRSFVLNGQFAVVELAGLTDMDQAAAMKGRTVFADREDFKLDEGEYFLSDLIGLDVIGAEDGRNYGRITSVENGAACDYYNVRTPEGERMLPAIPQFISRIEQGKAVYVNVIEGLLD